ncbi:MAG: hypothetical protein K9N52_07435, partial [Verrucomicrobia bacterium]|nr:hypothetical protein [Verrucomicrobiota bacterium]
ALETAMQKARELEEEKRQLLNELLGTGWRETPPIPQINPLTGAVFNSLTQEDKNKVQEIARRSQDRIQAYINAQNGAGQPVDPAELTRIRMNTRDELSQILTPTQLEEYLLRYSSTASELRNEMEGLGVGPEKFRAIFRNWDSINQQINLYYSNEDAVSRTNKDIYEQRKLDALKQYLEPEQFNLYMLNQDPVFTETTATAQANDIPADKIIPMYQINSATRDEIQSIENDITLSTEDKLDMIQEIKSEQQKSLLQLLGEERFSRIQE